MAHKHPIYDTDPHFKIDGNTRAIINMSDVKVALMQGDHNSERFTFEIPRYVDGHDMSLCNICQIHYLNVGSSTRATNAGIYEVEDLQFDPKDEQNRVVLSWLISSNVTMYVGSLSFVIRFGCSTDGLIDYIWNTAVCSGIMISSSICNSETVVQDYADILEQWRGKLGDSVTALKGDLVNIESCSASKIIAKAKDTDESGFNYYYDGSHQDSDYFRTTDFIDVSLYETITVTDKTTTSSTSQGFNAHVCFYDSNKQYVSGVHRKVESPSVEYSDAVSVPPNAFYAKISYFVSASDIFKVEAPIIICEKVNDNTNKISEIYPIKDAMEHREHSRNWFDDSKASVTSKSGVKGYLSDYIPVVQGDVLYASKNATRYIGGMTDESFFLVRYYNELKQNISNSDYWQLSVTVPSGVSYARCYVGQVDYARIMIEKNERTNIWEEYWDSGYIANDVKARNTSNIAIDSFLYGSVSMFDRIGAIGDSFTEGYAKASDGTYNTNKDHSYIGVMAKRAGINYANYGHSGATTRTYITDKLPVVLADSTCDFYFLALGINDVGLGTSYIGTVDDIHEDYTQNADTFYGNYGKIIAQVKAHSPKALFCLIKIPLCGTNVKAFNSAIDGVGEHFGIPVINPYDDEFFKTSVYENMNDGHPTLLGYTGMALAYERLLSKAIYDNPTYFKFATIG